MQDKNLRRTRLYNRFGDYLREKFGGRVYKIAVDAGLSCPNRDGTVGHEGCLFCDPLGGSGRGGVRSELPISLQIERGMEGLRRRYKAEKFLAYFQTFTNTYGPDSVLKDLYDRALAYEDVVGLAIATRPDCLAPSTLDLIQTYSPTHETWVELGVQSMREQTLAELGRGHGVDATVGAILALRERGIRVCAHLVLGLPGETRRDMIRSVRAVSGLGVDAVKFHMLYVSRHSRLAGIHRAGGLKLMSREEYVATVVHLLERLAPGILVQRLVSEAHPDILIAPDWLRDKSGIIRDIERRLADLNTFQGRRT
jgi:radical SAM protein (TIGR01212 family)